MLSEYKCIQPNKYIYRIKIDVYYCVWWKRIKAGKKRGKIYAKKCLRNFPKLYFFNTIMQQIVKKKSFNATKMYNKFSTKKCSIITHYHLSFQNNKTRRGHQWKLHRSILAQRMENGNDTSGNRYHKRGEMVEKNILSAKGRSWVQRNSETRLFN